MTIKSTLDNNNLDFKIVENTDRYKKSELSNRTMISDLNDSQFKIIFRHYFSLLEKEISLGTIDTLFEITNYFYKQEIYFSQSQAREVISSISKALLILNKNTRILSKFYNAYNQPNKLVSKKLKEFLG